MQVAITQGKRAQKGNEEMQKVIGRRKLKKKEKERDASSTWDVRGEQGTRWKQRDARRGEKLGWASRQTCR